MRISTENFKKFLVTRKREVFDSGFMRWWLGELAQMVPARMRSAGLSADNYRLIPVESVKAHSGQPEDNDLREMALTLPVGRVLVKTLSLPLATEENMRSVLEFQMEQHTPFSVGDVYFGYRVLDRDVERGQLTVQLAVTPRDRVDQAIKGLGSHGSNVRAVFSEEMLATGNLVNLYPTALLKTYSPWMRGPNPWLAALVGLLALTAMAMPLAIKREAVVQMLPWVEKGRKAAEAVDAVRRELETRVNQYNYLIEKRQMTPAVIQVVEELTRVLPDDTWVQMIEIKGKELQVHGETASSAKLIGLFEQSSVFREASFRSPLFKGQINGTERYQLAIQLRPSAKVEAPPPVVAPLPAVSAPQLSASKAP
jgi:general secretion pathway protein L